MKCPTCGHTPTTKRPKPIAVVDVDSLSDADLRAYRTRTAPYADVQFMIAHGRGLSPELMTDARALADTVDSAGTFAPGMTRTIFYRQYFALSARRRYEREIAYYRDVVIPAGKAAAWADAQDTAHRVSGSAVSIGTSIHLHMMIRSVSAGMRAEYAAAA